MTARLRETYKSDVFTALKDKFNYANVNSTKACKDYNQHGTW